MHLKHDLVYQHTTHTALSGKHMFSGMQLCLLSAVHLVGRIRVPPLFGRHAYVGLGDGVKLIQLLVMKCHRGLWIANWLVGWILIIIKQVPNV